VICNIFEITELPRFTLPNTSFINYALLSLHEANTYRRKINEI
jgi:hypothetical protein